MNPFSVIQVVFTSLVTVLFSWILPHKSAVSTQHTATPFPTIAISPFVSISPSSAQLDKTFIYPGATVTDNADGSKTLVSADDPNKITEWYKDKITVANMHSTSVSQTNSNNNILNVVHASSQTEEINVAIEHPAGNRTTTITLRVYQQ